MAVQLSPHAGQKAVQGWLFRPISNSLTRGQRISQQDGYASCLKASSLSNSHYKLFYLNNSLGYARIGIVVSKKQFKLAVLRNANKRLVREVFRNHSLSKCSLDLVVMVKSGKMLAPVKKKLQLVNLFSQLETQCVLY